MVKKLKFAEKYWLCNACAKKKGWKLPEPYMGTVIVGRCGHCKDRVEETLIPNVDFIKYKGHEPIWD